VARRISQASDEQFVVAAVQRHAPHVGVGHGRPGHLKGRDERFSIVVISRRGISGVEMVAVPLAMPVTILEAVQKQSKSSRRTLKSGASYSPSEHMVAWAKHLYCQRWRFRDHLRGVVSSDDQSISKMRMFSGVTTATLVPSGDQTARLASL